MSRSDRHKDVVHSLEEDAVKPAQLLTSNETPGLLQDTFGRPNLDRPADILINSPLGCSRTGAGRTALSVGVIVVKAEAAAPRPWRAVSASTRAEEEKKEISASS